MSQCAVPPPPTPFFRPRRPPRAACPIIDGPRARACPRLSNGLTKPKVPLGMEYIQHYHSVQADVKDRHPVGMMYHLGYLKSQQAHFILHARWKAWVDMHTLTRLEGLGVPFATQLLEDPASDSQIAAIVGAILGEL